MLVHHVLLSQARPPHQVQVDSTHTQILVRATVGETRGLLVKIMVCPTNKIAGARADGLYGPFRIG